MNRLKALFDSRPQFGARILAAALLIFTACAWYAILKPELKIKPDDSESLRRRIEAALTPGKIFLGSPVLVRTANKRYLVTIQENRLADSAYKAELADYLKAIAKQETNAQLDVVYAKSPTLLVKLAVSSAFNSSSAPFLIGVMFLALVRFFYAPVSAATAGLATYLAAYQERRALKKEAYAIRRREEEELAEAQSILDKDMAELQLEANIAFAAQAATAEVQRIAYEAAEAAALVRETAIVPGTITEIHISPSELEIEFEIEEEETVRLTNIARLFAKVPSAGPRRDIIATAAPLIQTIAQPETVIAAKAADEASEEAAFTPAAAGGLMFIEEKTQAESTADQAAEKKRSAFFGPLKAALSQMFAEFAEALDRRRDRIAGADATATAASTMPPTTDVSLDLSKLGFLETETLELETVNSTPGAKRAGASAPKNADFI